VCETVKWTFSASSGVAPALAALHEPPHAAPAAPAPLAPAAAPPAWMAIGAAISTREAAPRAAYTTMPRAAVFPRLSAAAVTGAVAAEMQLVNKQAVDKQAVDKQAVDKQAVASKGLPRAGAANAAAPAASFAALTTAMSHLPSEAVPVGPVADRPVKRVSKPKKAASSPPASLSRPPA